MDLTVDKVELRVLRYINYVMQLRERGGRVAPGIMPGQRGLKMYFYL